MASGFVLTSSAVFLWIAALASAVTAVAAWRLRNQFRGGTQFALMMTSILVWCSMSGTEATVVGVDSKVLVSSIGYIGICSVIPMFFEFAFAYGGRRYAYGTAGRVAVWFVPIVTILLTFTNRWHHLIWTNFVPAPFGERNVILYLHGPWFFVWLAYAALGTIIAQSILVRSAFSGGRFFLRQAFVFIVAAALPWVGELMYLWRGNPVPGFDFPSVGFGLAGLLILLGVAYFRLFDVLPIGRVELVEHMSDGLVVVDHSGRIVDLNSAARHILDVSRNAVGRHAEEVSIVVAEALHWAGLGGGETRTYVTLPAMSYGRFEVTISPLTGGTEMLVGSMIVFREVLFSEDGCDDILSMCASCRKVRDDSGNWQTIERYVVENFGKRFSHGLCDGCLKELYPELDISIVSVNHDGCL